MIEHTSLHHAVVAGPTDRSFGFVFAIVFLIIGLYPLLGGASVRIWALLISAGFLFTSLAFPGVLAPINSLWMKFGELLHRIVSPIALGVVFYLAVMPTGLLMRLLGNDVLRLRLDRTVESYWIKRNPPGPAADSLNNQF
jgi:hypothetical protein